MEAGLLVTACASLQIGTASSSPVVRTQCLKALVPFFLNAKQFGEMIHIIRLHKIVETALKGVDDTEPCFRELPGICEKIEVFDGWRSYTTVQP